MARLFWTAGALQDLDRLRRFLQAKDPGAARRAMAAIRQGVARMARFPASGRPANDMDAVFREWFIRFGASGYLILYHFADNEVHVLAVRHGFESKYRS